MRVSNLVGENYKNWEIGQFIFLDCPTGAGKSYFLLNVLMPYAIANARSIAIYVPRTTLLKKYQSDFIEACLTHNISFEVAKSLVFVGTYQALESQLCKGQNPPHSYYICLDEAHYFLEDAAFNSNTMLSYQYFCEHRSSVTLSISATGARITEMFINDLRLSERYTYTGISDEIVEKTYPISDTGMRVLIFPLIYDIYYLPRNYDYATVKYLEPRFKIWDIVQQDPQSKWLILISNIEMGKSYCRELMEHDISSAILYSENMIEEVETVDILTSMEKFNQEVLIATSVIDTGINIYDYDLRNIVLIADTSESFLQLLGRKRLHDGEKITLYIAQQTPEYFENRYRHTSELLSKFATIAFPNWDSYADVFEYARNYGWDANLGHLFCYTQNKLLVSTTTLTCLLHRKEYYRKMHDRLAVDPHAFIKEQLSWMNKQDEFDITNYISCKIRDDAFADFKRILASYLCEESRYTVSKGKELLKTLKPYAEKINRDLVKSTTFSYNAFNKFCENTSLPVSIDNSARKNDKVIYTFIGAEDFCTNYAASLSQ